MDYAKMSYNIKARREELGLTQAELARVARKKRSQKYMEARRNSSKWKWHG